MGCVSCHDPHEDRRVAAGDANQRCFGCHQDYAGPWIFEHAPVVDDCTICHDPHGAVTDDLLETAQPVVCLSCHSLNDLWHHTFLGTGIQGNVPATQDHPTQPGEPITIFEARPFLRRCTNCHGAIHGSFTDAHLRH
jgi:DmsE family decaheme c-type cytochrome